MCKGDFKAVRCPKERLDASRISRQMRDFNNFIQELSLVDLPLGGAIFTWTNRRVSNRLDRFLCSKEWLDLAQMFIQEALTSSVSCHSPIILRPFFYLRSHVYFNLSLCG